MRVTYLQMYELTYYIYYYKIMNIKQTSVFETGLNTKEAKNADNDQNELININHNKKKYLL